MPDGIVDFLLQTGKEAK
ncbi:hypothetical protein L195_g061890, partial [Trifolium pratense]